MRMRGIVRSATLEEDPPGSDRIQMRLELQGVSPGQPRYVVVPYELLLDDPGLDPDAIRGKRFEAEVEESAPRQWRVVEIAFATAQYLRPTDD